MCLGEVILPPLGLIAGNNPKSLVREGAVDGSRVKVVAGLLVMGLLWLKGAELEMLGDCLEPSEAGLGGIGRLGDVPKRLSDSIEVLGVEEDWDGTKFVWCLGGT